jgi:hypothetical protein
VNNEKEDLEEENKNHWGKEIFEMWAGQPAMKNGASKEDKITKIRRLVDCLSVPVVAAV